MHFATLNKVYCWYLIPHASHILQPLDLSVFGSLKRAYRKCIAQDPYLDDLHPIKQQNFIDHYKKAREKAITPTNCAAGFKAAGIVPREPAKAATSHFVLQRNLQALLITPVVIIQPRFQP